MSKYTNPQAKTVQVAKIIERLFDIRFKKLADRPQILANKILQHKEKIENTAITSINEKRYQKFDINQLVNDLGTLKDNIKLKNHTSQDTLQDNLSDDIEKFYLPLQRNIKLLGEILTENEALEEDKTQKIQELNIIAEIKASSANITQIVKRLNTLQKEYNKLKRGNYQIGVLAKMKAGKSTLTNAIMHQEVLPAQSGSCTGKITYINHTDSDIPYAIIVPETKGEITISFEHTTDLEKHLNKYAQYNWFASFEHYSEKAITVQNKTYPEKISNIYFLPPNKSEFIFKNQAKITIKKGNQIKISYPTQFELTNFINNQSVANIETYVHIPFLSETLSNCTIQFVDTPGPDSAFNIDHAELTKQYIQNANLIIYILSAVDWDGEATIDFLRDVKKERQELNDNEYHRKIFFVVNKIDLHSHPYQTVEQFLEGIKIEIAEILEKEAGEINVIGLSAWSALLYRLNQNGTIGRKKADYRSVVEKYKEENISKTEAAIKMYEKSNITELENRLFGEMGTGDLTQELVEHSLDTSSSIALELDNAIHMQKATAKTPLTALLQQQKDKKQHIDKANARKNELASKLQTQGSKFINNLSTNLTSLKDGLPASAARLFNTAKPGLSEKGENKAQILQARLNAYISNVQAEIQAQHQRFANLVTMLQTQIDAFYQISDNEKVMILQELSKGILGKNLVPKFKPILKPKLKKPGALNVGGVHTRHEKRHHKKWKRTFLWFGYHVHTTSDHYFHSINVNDIWNKTNQVVQTYLAEVERGIVNTIKNHVKNLNQSIVSDIDSYVTTLTTDLDTTIAKKREKGFDLSKELRLIEQDRIEVSQIIKHLEQIRNEINTPLLSEAIW